MANRSILLLTVKVLATMTAAVMICSPSITMYRIHRKKDVGLISVIPLASLLANNHMWMLYGYMMANWLPIFGISVFGSIVALTYLAVYWNYTSERRYAKRVLFFVLSILFIATIYAVVGGLGYTGQSHHEVGTVFGIISDVVSVFLYGAPLEKLFHVCKYRTAIFINIHMVIAGLVNNCVWFAYGTLSSNWYIILPNILFIFFNAFTLVLYLVYHPETHALPDIC